MVKFSLANWLEPPVFGGFTPGSNIAEIVVGNVPPFACHVIVARVVPAKLSTEFPPSVILPEIVRLPDGIIGVNS